MADNTVVTAMVQDAPLPKMLPIRQKFARPIIEDIAGEIRVQLSRPEIAATVKPGMRIAVTAGSRGIANIARIIGELCSFLNEKGARPFIVPAMGSHGGATADGQRAILESYGITEAACNAPIISGMEVAQIGHTEEGHPVHIDRHAAAADGIVAVGRIKAHTDFRGPFESGVMKMLVIGLGKQYGAEMFHASGPLDMPRLIPLYGRAILKQAPVLFGLGIVENAYEETCLIAAMENTAIETEEPPLLEKAKALAGRILFDSTDVLIVDRIGKDISGDGMDPNVTGAFSTSHLSGGLRASKRVVLGLTDATNGCMVGLGLADATTRRCFRQIDFESSYANSLTCTIFSPSKIPLVFKDDREAIQACVKYCGSGDKENPRVIRILDTLHLEDIWVSEAHAQEAAGHPGIEILGPAEAMRFDGEGRLL